jgi:hypothetical protein
LIHKKQNKKDYINITLLIGRVNIFKEIIYCFFAMDTSYDPETKDIGRAFLVFVAGLLIYQCVNKKNTSLPEEPIQKIEISSKYNAELNKNQLGYSIDINDSKNKTHIYGMDYNKDTIIDEIYFVTSKPDSTILNLASVKELSKIEKELLEK